ncbi:MAG: phosphatidate cytidylyltransferase, partial [Candidatus Saccharimonadales bacterium]
MSIEAAIGDPTFRFYALLAGGALLVAGMLLAVLRFGLGRNVDHAWRSYRGWLIMIPVLLAALFLGRAATIVFFTVLGVAGLHEFARATGLCQARAVYLAAQAGVAALGVVCLLPDPRLHVPGWYGLFMALPVYVVAAILTIPILANRTAGQLQQLALAVIGFIYFGWMFLHLAFLANSNHAYGYLLYLLFAVELNDVAAFTFGKLLGRRQLRSNISAKKTWAGALGAVAVSLVLPWLLAFTLPHFRAAELLLLGLLVGVGGQLGDLAISVIKRDIGIKDMGTTIPGHGGVLDR